MLRPLLALFAVGLPATVHAQTEVYSNIVGVHRLDVAADSFALASSPFLAGTNASVQEVVGPQMIPESSFAVADRIILWNQDDSSFINLYLRSHTNPTFSNKWIWNEGGIVATNEIPVGTGFWIQNNHPSNQVVVFAGDVVTDEAVTNTIRHGFQLVAYPYSADLPLNDSGLTNGYPGGSFAAADRITLWDPTPPERFRTFYLREHLTNPTFHRRWIDIDSNTVATNVLRSGEGFWYERHQNAGPDFQWVETRPYSLP